MSDAPVPFEVAGVYTPSAWGALFHTTTEDQVLGAGAAGPGKSTALIADILPILIIESARVGLLSGGARAAEQKLLGIGLTPEDPRFELCLKHPLRAGESKARTLHLRRRATQLSDSLDFAKTLYRAVDPGVRHEDNRSRHVFEFSCGMKAEFGGCNKPDDWENFMSRAFCMAEGERVVMADGSLRPIEQVSSGEYVSTMEGPRMVVAVVDSGVQPCVSSTIEFRGVRIGTHVHPSTHPVLRPPIDGLQRRQSGDGPCRSTRSPSNVCVWQDYESLLEGDRETWVKRASLLGAENGSEASDGSPRGGRRLPELSVPVVLHGPTLHRALSSLKRSMESSASCRFSRCSEGPSAQEPLLPEPSSRLGPLRTEERASKNPSSGTGSCSRDGGSGGRTGSRTPTGSTDRCSSCSCPRDGQPPSEEGACLSSAPPPVDVAERSPNDSLADALEHLRTRTCQSGLSYRHFYSGETRSLSEDARIGTAHLRFVGPRRTFDLTVDSSNHYISEFGLVNCNCHIGFDEANEFEEYQFEQITGRLRTSDPVLRYMMKVRLMANPFMRRKKGENIVVKNPKWVKNMFVDPAPQGNVVMRHEAVHRDGTRDVMTRLYLPATIDDNPNVEFREDYKRKLMHKPAHIREALLYGNWNITIGGYFEAVWDPMRNICKRFRPPHSWAFFRSLDWGFKSHGSVGWYALTPEDVLYKFREHTFIGRDVTEIAADIRSIEEKMGLWGGDRSLLTGPADTQIWEERGETGKRKVDSFEEAGVPWVQADKKSRAHNAERVAERLGRGAHNGNLPGLIFFNSCTRSIESTSGAPLDPDDPDVPLKNDADHWYDETSYAVGYASHGFGSLVTLDQVDDRKREGYSEAPSGQYGYGGW